MKYVIFFLFLLLGISCNRQNLNEQNITQPIEFKEFVTEYESKGKPPTKVRPGKGLIHLDFDGYYDSTATWGYTEYYHSGATPLEIEIMTQDVDDYYGEWDVEVTTDYSRWDAYPSNRRVRVIIMSNTAAFSGWASLNSTVNGEDKIAVVYFNGFNKDIRLVAAAISHEAGHCLGLRHHSDVEVIEGVCNVIEPYSYINNIMARFWQFPTRPIWSIHEAQNCSMQDDKKTISKVFTKLRK